MAITSLEEGRLLDLNDQYLSITEFSREELIGHTVFELDLWVDPEARKRIIYEILQYGEKTGGYPISIRSKSGKIKDILFSAGVIKIKNESYILSSALDITERRKMEEALRKSEMDYRLLFENSLMGISEALPDGRIIRANMAYAKMYGYDNPSQMMKEIKDIGQQLYANPEDRKEVLRILSEKGLMEPKEFAVVRRDGFRFHVLASAQEIKDASGKLISYQAAHVDITDRKQMEESLRESSESLRALINESPIAVVALDPEGNVTLWNPAAEKIFGWSQEEVLGKYFPIVPEDKKDEYDGLRKGVMEDVAFSGVELRRVKKDGSHIDISASAAPLHNREGKVVGVMSMIVDITERKQVEEEILRTTKFLNSIVENIPDMIFVKDAKDLRFVRFNRAGEELLGYSRDDLLGKNDYDFFPKEQAEFFTEKDRNVLRGGEILDIPEELIQTLNKGERVLHTKKVPILDEKGHPQYLLGISEDITERKQALDRIRKTLGATVQAIAVTVERRDPYTAGHQRRVSDLSRAIATEMGLSAEQIESLRVVGIIHDLGKISVPAEILSKPTILTKTEFELIKIHAQSGYDILKDIEFPWPIARMVLEHHERMDGSGYPNRLKGDEILLESRILAVADVVESMASHRPYRPALGTGPALEEISRNKGTYYDPEVVDACMRLFHEKNYKIID